MSKAQVTCTYLFADGHAVQVLEKDDNDAGKVQFVHIHEKWATGHCSFTGRLIFGRYDSAVAELCRDAKQIRAVENSLEGGSDNTRKLGIAVGYLTLETKRGSLHWYEMPGTISGPFTYQPDGIGVTNGEKFNPDAYIWAHYRVAKVFRVKTAPLVAAVA